MENCNKSTASLAKGFDAISVFVNDNLDAEVLRCLKDSGVKLILLRSTGYDNVDVKEAKNLGLKVMRVANYSPNAVAEYTLALILCLNRKIHKAYNRVRDQNFDLNGLIGFDMKDKTVGILGTGQIGSTFARIMQGFGCQVIAYDVRPSEALAKDIGFKYVGLDELLITSDILSLHVPLNPSTKHLINKSAIKKMKNGVMLINTSRGEIIDTKAVIKGLKSQKIGYLGIDVYERESNLFFQDISQIPLRDDVFVRLLTFPNVIITGHQAFLTKEAQHNIASTIIHNILHFEDENNPNQLTNKI